MNQKGLRKLKKEMKRFLSLGRALLNDSKRKPRAMNTSCPIFPRTRIAKRALWER
jgi:hypothetical protein